MDASRVAIDSLMFWLGENSCSLISGLFTHDRIFRLLALMGICWVGAHLLARAWRAPGSGNYSASPTRGTDRVRHHFIEFDLRTLCSIHSLVVELFNGLGRLSNPTRLIIMPVSH